MTTDVMTLQFDQPDVLKTVDSLSDDELDLLDFGVIGFDRDNFVHRYNRWESKMAGLSRDRVIGNRLFTTVAPCMNNFMIAKRFEDAIAAAEALDATIDYVFTLRMRPVKVRLRLLAAPEHSHCYVLVLRGL